MLVIAEKPSIARAIRLAIKPTPPVTALKGHILELDFPEPYSNWRHVDPRELFSAPVEWKIRDFETYKNLVSAIKGADMLILATDNDPEGELIAYEVLLIAKSILGAFPKYGRMRFNAATLGDLRHAWDNIEPSLKWNWVWKALLRHKFDLITGAAYTRLLTLSKKLNSGSGNNLISWGSCVKGDAIISGDYKPISEIKVGDHCIGWALSNNRVIRRFARSYSGQIVKIKAAGLLPIELTPEHPILHATMFAEKSPIVVNWRRSGDLSLKNVGKNYLIIPRIKGFINVDKIPLENDNLALPLNENTSWLIGAYVANGYISGDSAVISLSNECLRNKNIDEFVSLMDSLGSQFSIIRGRKTTIITITSKNLCKFLLTWCGNKPKDKRIPNFILLHENLKLVEAFLNGYINGKRCKVLHEDKRPLTFTTRSKVLALQLQMLYARLGRFLYLYIRNVKGRNCENKHPCDNIYVMRLKYGSEGASFKVFNDYILTPIRKVETDYFSGTVYNLETTDNTYIVSNAVVHNCQMPTLWFIYRREMEIRDFKPEEYYIISATLDVHGIRVKVLSAPIKDTAKAQSSYNMAKDTKYATITGFLLIDEVVHKPLPTDTDVMLQDLSKIMGLSAAKIMNLAENLYGDGYISYPRTETNMWLTVNHKAILSMLSSTPLARYIDFSSYSPRDGKKNDGAHPPIHPTAYYPNVSDIKYKVWEYIARRYLANVIGKNAILRRWKLNVNLSGIQMNAVGKYFVDEGFYRVFPYFRPRDTVWVPELQIGEKVPVINVSLEKRKTKPPPRLTEAELLRLLEEHSIGTDATRADYPQIIVERGYVEKKKKSFYLSDLGERLINLLKDVDERLVSPDTRRYVEHLMANVEAGSIDSESALQEALKIYRDLFEKVSIKLKSEEKAHINC